MRRGSLLGQVVEARRLAGYRPHRRAHVELLELRFGGRRARIVTLLQLPWLEELEEVVCVEVAVPLPEVVDESGRAALGVSPVSHMPLPQVVVVQSPGQLCAVSPASQTPLPHMDVMGQ